MFRKLTISSLLALTAALAMAPAAMTDEKVSGPFELTWNTCYGAPPSEEVPDWMGMVELDGGTYDILFFNVGTGRPPTDRVEAPLMSAHELWAIYDGLELAFDEECAVETFEGEAVMWGHDYGVVNFAESPDFLLTGSVLEASGDFSDLAGHDVEITGVVEFSDEGVPLSAPGEFVIS